MKRLAWTTDIHLNFLTLEAVESFCRSLAEAAPDCVLLGGDIGEATNVELYLNTLAHFVRCPIYFVLGNHDYYRSSIAAVRAGIEALCATNPRLVWLPAAGIVPLTKETALVGHDGWGDARLGDYDGSNVLLNDYFMIAELFGLDRGQHRQRLQALGDEAADHFRRLLPEILDRFREVIVLTHVPPFREASWHQGRVSADDWLPFFSCGAVGDVLRQAMTTRPDRHMTVLCGHTHGAGEAEILPNLHVITGGAEYGKPVMQRFLDVS